MSERFSDSGMLKIPTHVEEVEDIPENSEKISVKEAYCPNGHSLMDNEHTFNGMPGIKMAFIRPNEKKGVFSVSSKIGDLSKKTISGEIVEGEKVTLCCPECSAHFPVLAQCDKCKNGDMVLIYLSKELDVSDSASFCNLFGCPNTMLIKSDTIIRAMARDTL